MSEVSRTERANAIRALSMDAVQQANSGHPGMPMGMADIAEVLWGDVLKHNPNHPDWWNRDRFVLSNGHGSMLLYSLLHLTGYDLSIDDIKQFRQLHSKTPGHPEYGMTPGVETTTGPLGQGLAGAVGMAMAEARMAAEFNRDGYTIFDHYTYVFAGDGCLMEGISHEACSLAGTLGLGKLIVFYDDNGISIDGPIQGWFTDNTPQRFEAYGWQVVPNVDGHNPEAISAAITLAQGETNKPTLICCKTEIGFGSPNLAGTAQSHGSPLGPEEIAKTREQIGWTHPAFEIPDAIKASWDAKDRGYALEVQWQTTYDAYKTAYPNEAAELHRRMNGLLPDNWESQVAEAIASAQQNAKPMATRAASLVALEGLGPVLPELSGGSADLTGSNKTKWSQSSIVSRENPQGNYIYYGVREFAMSAIANGMALHGGILPYTGTFLVFSDYARNALRLASLMKIRSIFVYSHDSIGLGEDGPTHQAVEHAESLRLIPQMQVWRPADLTETIVAWKASIERQDGPSSLLLTRQNTPPHTRSETQIADIEKGGYVLVDADEPKAILIATGSEVGLAVDAAHALGEEGIPTRVVSVPCRERFEQQTIEYQHQVLPPEIKARVAIEAGVGQGWYRLVGAEGAVVSLESFGESAPAEVLFAHFGFTTENIVRRVKERLA